MNTKKESLPAKVNSHNSKENDNKIILGKLDTMFRHFAEGKRLHRFQAERLADHCLPTTIADLQKLHPIYFDRIRVKVTNRFGTETNVMMYWLEGEHLHKARTILGWEVAA